MKKILLIVLCALAVLISCTPNGGKSDKTKGDKHKSFRYTGPMPPVRTAALSRNGLQYELEAFEGQAVVLFDKSMSHSDAVKILERFKAEIIAQMPAEHYYMVKVDAGSESVFVNSMSAINGVDFVYPNAVRHLRMAKAYVIDDFIDSHGKMVTSMFQGCNPLLEVETYNILDEGSRNIPMNAGEEELLTILGNLGGKESAVINISYGFALKYDFYYDLSNYEKRKYNQLYIDDIEQWVKLVKQYDSKDFVITYASGNDGMHSMENIIDEARNRLTPEEYSVFERHFIIVSAKDDNRETEYPNDVSYGRYNSMMTKVDISDMTDQDLDWQGTSFSSPRAAGYIVSVANKKNAKVTDVLKSVRDATRQHPSHLLTEEMLESFVANDDSQSYDCLSYRLLYLEADEYQSLELQNTCNEDIRVKGYLVNALASHGGSNRIDFDEIIQANDIKYIEGFIENECTINSVEKVFQNTSNPSKSVSSQGIPNSLVGTKWTVTSFGTKTTVEFISSNRVQITTQNVNYWISEDELKPSVSKYDCYYDSKINRIVVIDYPLVLKRFEYENGRLVETNYVSIVEYERIE